MDRLRHLCHHDGARIYARALGLFQWDNATCNDALKYYAVTYREDVISKIRIVSRRRTEPWFDLAMQTELCGVALQVAWDRSP